VDPSNPQWRTVVADWWRGGGAHEAREA
jgi:hypothetical protein